MVWITLYAAVALVSAVAVYLFAERIREPGHPAPDHAGVLAGVAGLLWPVLIVGVLQLGAVVALKARARARVRVPAQAEPAPRTLVGSAA